jgi:hypothetical protein
MQNPVKKISPALFGLTLICFCLPFVSLSCQGDTENRSIITLTGVELATGKNINPPSNPISPTPSQEGGEKIPSSPFATLAILSGIIGLGTSFIKAKKSAIAPASSGVAGFILLLVLKSTIDKKLIEEGGFIVASYGLGFWLTFILFISASLVNIYSLVEENNNNKSDMNL